jgi:hypothetical protein
MNWNKALEMTWLGMTIAILIATAIFTTFPSDYNVNLAIVNSYLVGLLFFIVYRTYSLEVKLDKVMI